MSQTSTTPSSLSASLALSVPVASGRVRAGPGRRRYAGEAVASGRADTRREYRDAEPESDRALGVRSWVLHDTAWVSLSGAVSARGARRDLLAMPSAAAVTQVVIDLSGVRRIDADAREQLRAAAQGLHRAGMRVALIDPQSLVHPAGEADAEGPHRPCTRRARAYCGPAHHQCWALPGDVDPPPLVYEHTAAGVHGYHLVRHPATGRAVTDHLGNYPYVPAPLAPTFPYVPITRRF